MKLVVFYSYSTCISLGNKKEKPKVSSCVDLSSSCVQAAWQPDISHFLSPTRITSYSCSLI